MLKKIAVFSRKQLLKVKWIRREVEAYQKEQEDRRHRERWAKLMSANYAFRRDEKSDEADRKPRIMESTQWGIK